MSTTRPPLVTPAPYRTLAQIYDGKAVPPRVDPRPPVRVEAADLWAAVWCLVALLALELLIEVLR